MNIVFDIGGTNLRIAGVHGEVLGEIKKVKTPQEYDELVALIGSLAKELAAGEGIGHAAGCIAGQIDAEKGLYDANNRKHWEGKHIDTDLAAAIGAPVKMDNDCAVIGLGEYVYGAGKGTQRFAYATVSTGVGAAHIVQGDIVPVGDFFLGHVVVDGEELEPQISGTAVKKKFGVEPKDLDSIDERNKLADILAKGLVSLIEKWQPERIVLGGSMIVGVNPIPLDRAAETLATLMQNPPEIRMASLGDTGGLYGGMVLAAK